MDSRKILEELDQDDITRHPVSLRIDGDLWGEFRSAIGNAPQNKVMERLIRNFLDGLKTMENQEGT